MSVHTCPIHANLSRRQDLFKPCRVPYTPRAPDGARLVVILQEHEAREELSEICTKTSTPDRGTRAVDVSSYSTTRLRHYPADLLLIKLAGLSFRLSFLQRTSNAGRMFCTSRVPRILKMQQSLLEGAPLHLVVVDGNLIALTGTARMIADSASWRRLSQTAPLTHVLLEPSHPQHR